MKRSEKELDKDFIEMKSSFEAQWTDSVNKIQELAQAVDAVRLFVAVLANMAFGPAEHMREATYGTVPAKIELLAYHLYPFFGISNNSEITLGILTNASRFLKTY